MLYKNSDFKYCNTVDFQGTIIAFFRDDDNGQIYYDVLELKGTESVDDKSWTGYAPVKFSQTDEDEELRPLGTQLIQLDREVTGNDDKSEFRVLSDDNYIYLFRGSDKNSIYLNRFVLVTEVDEGSDGDSRKVLLPIWEVRYKHSGLRDTPANVRDTQDYRDPTGEPFIEPTLEIPYIYNRDEDGCWTVLLIPTDVPNRKRWQFFWITRHDATALSNLSFLQDDDGLMSLDGVDQSDVQKLYLADSEGNKCKFATSLSAVYYQQQEPYSKAGKKQDQKTNVESQARIMLASGGTANNNRIPLFALDFGVGFDGNIVKFPNDPFKLPPVTVGAGDGKEDGTNSFSVGYEDDQGLTINSWMMNLYEADKETVVMGEGPDLLSSGDGKIHLYFKDTSDDDYLKVVQYDAVRERVTFQANWESMSGYSINNEGEKLSGNINFVAKSFYVAKIDKHTKKPEHPIKIKGASSELDTNNKTYPISFMYEVIFQKGNDKTETWYGVPDDLGLFVGTLNGLALDDPQSSLLLNGQQAFYDYFQKQTLYVFNSQSRGGAGIVSCLGNTPDVNGNPSFTPTIDQDGEQWTLDLKQDIILNKTDADNNQTKVTITLTEQWPSLDNDTQKFIKTLNGQAPDYKYSDVIFQLGGKDALLYADPSQQRGLWFIACNTDDSGDVDLNKIRIRIIVKDTQTNEPGQEQCKVIIEMVKNDVSDLEHLDPKPLDPELVMRATWNNVPRQVQGFNNYFQTAKYSHEEHQQDVLAVITPYAKGTQELANVVLNHPADSRGGAFLIATVNYGGEGELQETPSNEDPATKTVLMQVNQCRVLSPTLEDNLSNYYNTIPKHSGLFDVVIENFPEDGHPTKVIQPAKQKAQLLKNGYLGQWLTVADNYALEIVHTNNRNEGFSTSKEDDHISLTGEMGIEAWLKVPDAEDYQQAITIVKERDDGDKSYSLDIEYYLERDSKEKKRVHMELVAYSDDITGTSTYHTHHLDSITQWKHVAAMKESGFYVDLSPAQVQDPELTPEQLYLDAGTDTIIGSPNNFTVETLCFIKQNNTEQVIASQWRETPDEQSWKLSIGKDNKLNFYIKQDNGSVYKTESSEIFNDREKNTWKHIAAVYSTQSVNKTGLVLSDSQYIYVFDFPGQTSYTSEFWFHRKDPTRTEDFGGLVNDKTYTQIGLSFVGDTLYYYSRYHDNSAKHKIDTSGVQILEVNHFAYTYDGKKQIKFYLNGMLLDTVHTSGWDEGFMSDDYPFKFGFADVPGDENPLQGFMTDIRIWTVERTREEIALSMDKRLLGNEEGLWCYLPLDNLTSTLDNLTKTLESEVGDRKITCNTQLEFSDQEFANCSTSIYVNGKLERVTSIIDAAIASSTAPVLFGREITGKALSGGLDGIRLWDTPRPNWAIDLYRMNNLDSSLRLVKGDKKGLLADWAFSDKDGTVVTDRVYNSPLIVKSMVTDKETRLSPSDFYFANYYRAQWHIYLDGIALNVNQTMSSNINKVVQQNGGGSGEFYLGKTQSDNTTNFYLDDVRLWSGMRTAEQVRDNMYRRLNTDERNLSAYWIFGDFLQEKDPGSGPVNCEVDHSGNGHSLDITQDNVKQDQSVPVCDEHPVVQNAMGGAKMPQNAKLTRSISVVEYSDVEQDFDGNLSAVLKRVYVFADEGKGGINLVTGFKVDNLEMIYLGMAQTQPTLIGYLEGPPPVPSENLTRPYWTRFNTDEYARYNDACSIQLTEALDTTYHYSSQKGSPATTNWELKGGFAFKTNEKKGEVILFTHTLEHQTHSIEGNLGVVLKGSESSGTPKSLSKSVALSKHLTEQMTLQGGWEPLSQLALDKKDLGDRRFIPANKGYALVKSSTANVYLFRLKRTKTVVNTALVPNPDTPEDWNIITFPIDPKYVKNGTLDGRVGFKSDPDYLHTSDRDLVYNEQENSYFKPREAYAIKQRIERDEKRLEAFYERLNQRYIGKKVNTSTQLRGLGNTSNAQNVPDSPGYDWDKKLSKRNLVNTYVWSADLGFFAEENQTMDVREESLGASYGMQLEGGIEGGIKALVGYGGTAGLYASASVLAGKNLNVSIAKNKEESDGFGMEVGVTADDLLNKWLGVDPNARLESGKTLDPKYSEMDGYSLEAEPGKVQSYRFMSFYLAPHERNWNDFYKKVVDPAWLRNSNDPDARALREAKPHKNGVWRVMHRVTYVNRIPPHYLNAPVEELDDPANVPANLEDNTIITDLVKNALDNMDGVDDKNNPSRANIADAVYHVLGYEKEKGDGSGYRSVTGTIAQTYPWWTSYWAPGSLTPEQETIRKNITGYMLKYYETVSMSVIAQEVPTEE